MASAFLPVKSKIAVVEAERPDDRVGDVGDELHHLVVLVDVVAQDDEQRAEREDRGERAEHDAHRARDLRPGSAFCVASWRRLRSLSDSSVRTLGDTVSSSDGAVRSTGGAGVSGPRTGPCRDHSRRTSPCRCERSSVANRPANCWRSISSPVSRSTSSPRSTVSLAARRAYDAASANCRAHVTASSYTSSAGTTLSTRPIASASSALTNRPVKMRSLARLGPDQPGQPLGAAGARDDAEQDLRLAEGRVVGGDPDVGAQRELAAAAERVAGHRGDDRLGDAGDRDVAGLQPAGDARSCRCATCRPSP